MKSWRSTCASSSVVRSVPRKTLTATQWRWIPPQRTCQAPMASGGRTTITWTCCRIRSRCSIERTHQEAHWGLSLSIVTSHSKSGCTTRRIWTSSIHARARETLREARLSSASAGGRIDRGRSGRRWGPARTAMRQYHQGWLTERRACRKFYME